MNCNNVLLCTGVKEQRSKNILFLFSNWIKQKQVIISNKNWALSEQRKQSYRAVSYKTFYLIYNTAQSPLEKIVVQCFTCLLETKWQPKYCIMSLPVLWTRACADKSLSEWTSKRSGWNKSSRALGRWPGSLCRHLWMKSFCCSSSSDSIVRWIFSSVTRVPESPLPWISNAAISKAHIPNE